MIFASFIDEALHDTFATLILRDTFHANDLDLVPEMLFHGNSALVMHVGVPHISRGGLM